MGIRFTCHVCSKRLNVKGFLAGKRGICPHCGAKVEIPWESQAGAGDAESESPQALPQSVATSSAANGASNGTGAHQQAAVPMGETLASATTLPTGGTTNPASAQSAATAAVSGVTTASPVAAAVMLANPVVSTPSVATPPPDPSPPLSGPRDPIAEAPSAVWYVRPPTGGQFGPAAGDIMRKWITEGRISADSLIWRDGWADWKSASSQFPQLGGDNAPANAGISTPPKTAPQAPAFGEASSPSRAYSRRKNSNTLALIVVVVLSLASIGLLGVLIAVQ